MDNQRRPSEHQQDEQSVVWLPHSQRENLENRSRRKESTERKNKGKTKNNEKEKKIINK